MMSPLEFESPDMVSDIDSVLKRRGLRPVGYGNEKDVIYPLGVDSQIVTRLGMFEYQCVFHGKHPRDHFVDHFERASFRKLIRLLLREQNESIPITKLGETGGASVLSDLEFLENILVIERRGDPIVLLRRVDNIGQTFEYCVSRMCVHDLRGSAKWGVKIDNLPRTGGDYDVLAWLDPCLVYIECKTSQPDQITESQLRQFFQRSVELAPELAILLFDSESSLDMVLRRMERMIMDQSLGASHPTHHTFHHPDVYKGIAFGFNRVFVTNTKHGILPQLRKCLQYYHAYAKGFPILDTSSANFPQK